MGRILLAAFLFLCSPLLGEDQLLLVSHKADSSLGFCTMQGKHLASVPVGKHPHEMVLSPDGSMAFASAQWDDTVYVVSVSERQAVREVKTPSGAGPDPVLEIRARGGTEARRSR